ncbi:glycosyltransferase family 2 protein [Pseudomonas aeruginosa]|uniref:glycosyltransferase family 2 protein n=1 Tax=Pseudomonas aeruginosa TaxID=287 RepID=UPI00249C1587|nr:glycosyltransferase family A protein [Pseudomonas aeruginosa]MDF5801929.1 glycosyltransferase family A protein [Pseudomonas aeruginosa]MDF5914409.1 glycosyltransferase family A protein [Pseudomonas aeruginosa]WGW36609.1 glycosyltransferase family A protein [Pseudomonas aeruginosa]WGW52483.1 glycosyltransferase family A protein [Pseudomonas aeruginosa]
MLLSVVVSTWRRPKELKLVLAGLVAQSLAFKDFEVIVVDSNSGDETPDVVREFEAVQGFNVRLEQAELNSASAKRNKGVRLAKGRYVVLLDDDCVPDPAHLSNFLNAANSRRGNALSGAVVSDFLAHWCRRVITIAIGIVVTSLLTSRCPTPWGIKLLLP